MTTAVRLTRILAGMKSIGYLLLLCIFSSTIARADDARTPPLRKVTVTGTCQIKVVPDKMLWSIEVSINEATLAKAKLRHDASLSAALNYLKTLGSALQDTQTGGISFAKDSDGDSAEARRHPYNCATDVTFTLTNFDQYGSISDALARIDGLQVRSVCYGSSKEAATRREALKRSMLDAHDKAAGLAEAAHCRIDRPLEIDEEQAYFSPPGSMYARETGDSLRQSTTPAALPGQIEIDAKVIATYDLSSS